MSKRTYFTLLSRAGAGQPWVIEFGDYDRETVEEERADYRDHDVKASNLRIISTADTQAAISKTVAAMNHVPAQVAA